MKRKTETGSMTNELTRRALRCWARRIFLRALFAVVVVNALDAIILRVDVPAFVATIVLLIMLGAFGFLIQSFIAYFRLSRMKVALAHAEWQVISGCCRSIFIGPIRVAQIVVVETSDGQAPIVDLVQPLQFAQRLPGVIEPDNLLLVQWRRTRVYSSLDGACPVIGRGVRSRKLRSLLEAVVRQ